jgi:hypothetical protein
MFTRECVPQGLEISVSIPNVTDISRLAPQPCENWLQALQYVAGDIGEVLSGLHDVQVVVRLDIKKIEHLVQHLAMLCCDADDALE